MAYENLGQLPCWVDFAPSSEVPIGLLSSDSDLDIWLNRFLGAEVAKPGGQVCDIGTSGPMPLTDITDKHSPASASPQSLRLLLPVKTMVAEDQPRASANADPIPEYVALSDVALNKNAGRTVSTTNCSHVASSPASPGAAYESDGSDESHWDSSQAHHIANGLPAIAQPSSIKATDIVNISSVNVLPDKEIYSASASKKRKHVADNESGSKKVVLEMADGAPGPSRTHQKPGKKAATAAEYDAKGVSHQPCAFPGCTTDVPVKNWGRHMKYVFLLAAVATLADFAALSSDRTPEWHHCDWEGCSYQAKRTDNLKTHKQNVHKVPKPAKSGRRVKKTV